MASIPELCGSKKKKKIEKDVNKTFAIYYQRTFYIHWVT